MRWDQFWGSYSMRIAGPRHKQHRSALIKWLRNSKIQRLKLPPSKRIVSVTVWWIDDRSPNPLIGGEPKIIKKYVVAQWPEKKTKK
jgi:hypothetical protein